MARRGFTLIELLVVIAIVAILAAILFPVFVQAKERARQAKCCSNLKQLTQAFFSYCDDNNGFLPMGSRRYFYNDGKGSCTAANAIEWTGTQWSSWSENTCYAIDPSKGSLWRYVRNRAVYNCPTDQDLVTWSGTGAASPVGWNTKGSWPPGLPSGFVPNGLPAGLGLSYSLNYCLALKDGVDVDHKTTVKLAAATAGRASQVLFLIHETRGKKGQQAGINDGFFSWPGDWFDRIHWDGTTCSYSDGHVKWLPNNEMKKCEEANPSPWWRNSRYYRVDPNWSYHD